MVLRNAVKNHVTKRIQPKMSCHDNGGMESCPPGHGNSYTKPVNYINNIIVLWCHLAYLSDFMVILPH
jgi:hypothetical protein